MNEYYTNFIVANKNYPILYSLDHKYKALPQINVNHSVSTTYINEK